MSNHHISRIYSIITDYDDQDHLKTNHNNQRQNKKRPSIYFMGGMYMITSSNGKIFRVTGPLCGEFTGHRWIPLVRPVTQSFDVLFDLCLNKRLSKQSQHRWFEKPSRSLWRRCNGKSYISYDFTLLYFGYMTAPWNSKLIRECVWQMRLWRCKRVFVCYWETEILV